MIVVEGREQIFIGKSSSKYFIIKTPKGNQGKIKE
jgi:hypothetical protein